MFPITHLWRRPRIIGVSHAVVVGSAVVLISMATAASAGAAAPTAPAPGSAPVYLPIPNGNGSLNKIPAGGGTPVPVSTTGLQYPTAIAVAASGTIYLSELNDPAQIVKLAPDGTMTTLTKNVTQPLGLAVDAAEDVFVADTGANRVLRIDAQTGAETPLGQGLSKPQGVAVDSQGRLLIADTGNNRVVAIANGTQTTLSLGSLQAPSGVAVNLAGTIFVADTGNSRVVEVPVSGSPSSVSGRNLNQPVKVGVDGRGNLFIADALTGVWEAPADNGPLVSLTPTVSFDVGLPPIPAVASDVSAVAAAGSATVTFQASGAAPGSTYSVTAQDQTTPANGGQLAQSASGSPVQLTGLTNGDAYTFTVTVTNPAGATGGTSAPSATVTPVAAAAHARPSTLRQQLVDPPASGADSARSGSTAGSLSVLDQALLALGVLALAGVVWILLRAHRSSTPAAADRPTEPIHERQPE